MELMLHLGLLLACGLVANRLIKLVRMPDVTGYLVIGLLLGPNLLGLFSQQTVDELSVVSDVALAFIAFTVGGEFKLDYFRRVGAAPIVIACCESFGAVLLVTAALLAVGAELPLALLLGAIAAATAPAATIMVINQYKAKGPVTEMLLAVVAIDDATALIAFGLASAFAGTLASGGGASLLLAMLRPVLQIFAALALGFVMGLAFTLAVRFFKSHANRTTLAVCFVLLAAALADGLGLSALLLCMAMGAAFNNTSPQEAAIYEVVNRVTPPIFMLFFVLSGADLKLSVLPQIGLLGIVYLLVRAVGKYLGAGLGGKLMHTGGTVAKYLGPCLLPQAGVAIGLSYLAQQAVPQYAQTIRAVVLCATFVYELIGPLVTKTSLKLAGEIRPEA